MEAWVWRKTSHTVFKDYIDLFLKKKIEASGLPDSWKGNISGYVAHINDKEGIQLDASAIEHNGT